MLLTNMLWRAWRGSCESSAGYCRRVPGTSNVLLMPYEHEGGNLPRMGPSPSSFTWLRSAHLSNLTQTGISVVSGIQQAACAQLPTPEAKLLVREKRPPETSASGAKSKPSEERAPSSSLAPYSRLGRVDCASLQGRTAMHACSFKNY